MSLTKREHIAKAMYVGTKEVFMDNLAEQPEQQWKSYAKIKNSDGMEEKYDTVGNLKPAAIKVEGDPVVYGKIVQGHTTTVKNDTVANGFSVTMEAKEDEKWGIVPEVKVSELVRTMIHMKEKAVAKVWDDTTTAIGADGVPYASYDHPLLNTNGANDNLVKGVFDIDSYQDAVIKFNHWKNHYAENFFTTPTALLAHRDRQTNIFAMLQSTLLPFQNVNTKNTIPQLKTIFSNYINSLQVHVIDEGIDSAILQERKGFDHDYDYDNRLTFNFYYNVHERYKAAMINPGFGFVTITGKAVGAKIILLATSEGTAGDKKVTGLTATTKYTITYGGNTYAIAADGTVDKSKSIPTAGLTSTEITGLENGRSYLVKTYTDN